MHDIWSLSLSTLLLFIYCLIHFPLYVGVLCLSLFCYTLLCFHFCFAIILKWKRKLVALLLKSCRCIVTVNILWLFFTVLLVGLQYVIVVFFFIILTFCRHKLAWYLFVCLFVWYFTSQSTMFQLCQDGSSWVEPVLNKDICVLPKDTMQWRQWARTRVVMS